MVLSLAGLYGELEEAPVEDDDSVAVIVTGDLDGVHVSAHIRAVTTVNTNGEVIVRLELDPSTAQVLRKT